MDSMTPIADVFNNFVDTMLFLINGFLEQAITLILGGFLSLLP